MTQKTTIKLTALTKDFDMKSKDVLDVFKALGIEKKSGASVELGEFELFFSRMTKDHQMENIEDYLAGRATIREPEKPQEPEKPAEPEVKPAAPAEKKPAAKPAEAPRGEKPSPAAQGQGGRREGQSPRPAAQPAQGQMPRRDGQAPRPAQPAQGQMPRRDGQSPRQNTQQGQGARHDERSGYGRYTGQPQENPFAKKHDNMVKAAQGIRTPQQIAKAQEERRKQETAQKPAAGTSAALPAQQALLEKQQKQQKAAQTQPQATRKKEEKKPQQKQQFKTLTPMPAKTPVQGGVNLNAEYTETAPKTRVVDTRTSDVNLSKYDERFSDRYSAIARGTEGGSSKQKIKKQDNRGQNAKSAKDKQRAAAEKIKRMEAEMARKKQLEITVPDEISVGELASRLKKTSAEVLKKLLLDLEMMKTVNDILDFDTAEWIADAFGAKVKREVVISMEEKLFTEAQDAADDLVERAPVVCVMGHVDHGKTSILDAIRHTNVTEGEAGGITQAIGAYRVKVGEKDVTFLDTPGHEAFTAMRMRGAKSTDIAILVVAADDGIMPQTVEAISHAKAAGIDIIVAINKMDKPQANPDNVLNQLTQYELVPEQWGGDVICVPVSALTGQGIPDLLESVLLVAEMKELKANPNKRARGIVLESRLDRGCGPVATILVQNGTLHQGDYVIVGDTVGRVRQMKDDKRRVVKTAGPSVPVEITGLENVPQAGDELNAVEDERMAKTLADQRREKQRQEELAANARVNLDDLFTQIADGVKTLNIIVKADVAGSAEAVKASLLKLSNDEVKISVIHSGVGGITDSDVILATASNAIIVGFNVRPDKNALDSAERNKVDIRTHRIIYEIIDEIEAAMKGMLAPTFKETLLGHAQVRQTIHVPNVGMIAGSYIQDGKVTRQAQIRVVRDGIVIFEDKISSLRRFKEDVREVAEGYECGIGLDKFNDIKINDILEAYIMEEVKR